MWSFTKQNKVVIEYSKRKQGILLKSNYCGCETLGENKEQNRFYRKGGIAAEAVLSQIKETISIGRHRNTDYSIQFYFFSIRNCLILSIKRENSTILRRTKEMIWDVENIPKFPRIASYR